MVKRLMVIAALALSLGGCLTIASVNNSASRNTLYGIVNSYGVLLSAAQAYKSLALCKTGHVWTLQTPCAQRSVVMRLQSADAKVVTAITAAGNFMNAYPTLDATNLIAAAETALTAYQTVVAQTGAQ